jgi:curli biogenesis system outer membrane secretion channel CsgG
MKILASLLIVLAFGAAGCARRTVVYTPAASPATVVAVPTPTTPVYVVKYDNRAACQAAGGRWHSFARRCDF